jgi:hypothetical protein
MIGFLLRKTLYDMWDNLLKIVVINLGFLISTAVPVFLPMLASKFAAPVAVEMALAALGVIFCSIYLAAAAYSFTSVSDYGSFTFADFFRNFKYAWKPGIAMGLFLGFLYLVFTTILPFYLAIESPAGLFLAAVVFWATVFAIISFQFYFAVYARLGKKLGKSFKKCMIISLDNSGLALFLLINNVIAIAVSAITIFMFPGPVGALLYIDEALRLRLLKYDWLEANPNANRKKIPWDELLIEEREKTGVRTFRNFIFPWKD